MRVKSNLIEGTKDAVALKAAVLAACLFESYAIGTGRVPTISTLCGRHRWLRPVIVGGLIVHLWKKPRVRVPEVVRL